MEKTKYAYLAGIIDGEGYIGLSKFNVKGRKAFYKARIIISNCNMDLLNWIHKNFGGYVSKKTKGPNDYQGYNLQIGYADTWLPKVIPYLIGKKKKAILFIEALKLLDERRKKTQAAGDMHLERLEEINALLRKKEWLI
jgi:hypothetical protein